MAESSWDNGKTYTYWVRHYHAPGWTDKARVTGWSDGAQVSVPQKLVAYISGRDTVPADKPCAWTGVVEQGTSPYSYLGSGDVSDSVQVITRSFSWRLQPYQLIFTGTDSLGWQALDTLEVYVTKSGGACQLAPSGP